MSASGATDTGGVGQWFWNPGAIGYLVELLLALLLALYLAKRVFDERRRGKVTSPTLLLCLAVGALLPALFASLLHAMAGGGWERWVMPWLSPRSAAVLAMPWVAALNGVAVAAFVQFAYRFPQRLPGSRREGMVVGAAMGLFVAIEIGIALRTDLMLADNHSWSRSDWFSMWMNAGLVWSATLFVRQFAHAQASPARGLALAASLFDAILRPATSREAAAARAFLVFALLPIAHTGVLVLQSVGLLGEYSLDVFVCWLTLVELAGLTLVYVSYMPERSSFLFKLTVISAAILLGAVNAVCWVIAPAYFAEFRAPGLATSGQQIRFTPTGQDYTRAPGPFAPEPAAGTPIPANGRVPLPFEFHFYGKPYRSVHIDATGTIRPEGPAAKLDETFGYGTEPALYPLLVHVPASGTRVTAQAHPDRLVVTRQDRCAAPANCYVFQSILRADGRIDFAYLQIPERPAYHLFHPLDAPWLSGITPGDATRPGLIRDHYRDFLGHLDRLFAPIVWLLILGLLALISGLPLLFHSFLVRPLDRLMQGMRQFRSGDLGRQVDVTFNDEIGYVTESFNSMAQSLNAMVHDLEVLVAERVAQVGDITARNAQLEERNRLSADLHDSVSQILFSSALLADTLPDRWRQDPEAGIASADQIRTLNREALREMRLLLTELRTGHLTERPLAEVLSEIVRGFATPERTVDAEVGASGDLPQDVQAMLVRVTHECLHNIARHAQASRVTFEFEAVGGRAMLRVADNGRGFDPDAPRGGHFGIDIMRSRAERAGASFEMESAPGRGTTVTVIWPSEP